MLGPRLGAQAAGRQLLTPTNTSGIYYGEQQPGQIYLSDTYTAQWLLAARALDIRHVGKNASLPMWPAHGHCHVIPSNCLQHSEIPYGENNLMTHAEQL
jgi:hypothetical protein